MDHHALIAAFGPDPDALVALLRPEISDAALDLLAHIDYGHGAAKAKAELIELRDAPFQWRPLSADLAEVVQLASFGPPFADYTGATPIEQRAVEAVAAFNCANILRGLDFDSNYHFGATIKAAGVLLGQAMVEVALQRPLARLLAWNLSTAQGGYRLNASFVSIALLYLKEREGLIGSSVTLDWLAEYAIELELWRQQWETGSEDRASMFRRDDDVEQIRPKAVWGKIADALSSSERVAVAEIGAKLRLAI